MAYYIRKGLVEENKDFLEQVLMAIHNVSELKLPCKHVTEVPRLRNYVNKLLRACRDLPTECNGRYASLRHEVTVSDNLQGPAVILKARSNGIMPATIITRVLNPDETAALDELRSKRGQELIPLTFTPSPTYPGDEWLRTQIELLGYELYIDEIDLPGGEIKTMYVAKYLTPKRGMLDLLSAYSHPQ
jgi:hypothetical protein